jgi:preprotein translocase subunit SecA
MAGRGVDIKLGGNPTTESKYQKVKKIGGLFVLGTERHEARRIDNQLRGRSGRQGDPGETQFFVSLEDPLMRVFASDTIKNMMGRFGIPEDQPIENKLITRSLESAQTKIEGLNFDRRRHVLEFDDVLNQQRQSVYKRRRDILLGDKKSIEELIKDLISDHEPTKKIIDSKRELLGEEEFQKVIKRIFLQTIDMLWVDHLEMMDYLRSSVNLRAYGQRDPLVEYKKEGLKLFKEMEESIDENVLKLLPGIGEGAYMRERQKLEEVHKSAQLIGGEDKSEKSKVFRRTEDKINRNDPCPCGSGKKYKKCGYLNKEEHQHNLDKT